MKYTNSINLTIVSTLALTLGYTMNSLWPGAIAIVTLGLSWLVGQQRQIGWLTDFGFIALVIAAAIGVWWGVGAGWMLVGTVGALAAWDLARFAHRLRQAAHLTREKQMTQAHLQRLLPVAGSGLVLGGFALSVQLELSFGWTIVLGLLVIFGLSQIFKRTNNESEQAEKT